MRKIKFKTWDEKNDIIIGPWEVGSEASFEWEPQMQYTEWKDKNGVEIYEYDKVRLTFHDNYHNENMTVIPTPLHDPVLEGIIKFVSFGWFVIINPSNSMPFCDLMDIDVDIEVIGNTYYDKKQVENMEIYNKHVSNQYETDLKKLATFVYNWCHVIDKNGGGWDYWDDYYKDAYWNKDETIYKIVHRYREQEYDRYDDVISY